MPRPRSFDQDTVLDAAMRVFWTAGYEATSTERLCEATGLLRGSLYNAFTSKHALFTATLERYVGERTGRLVATLDGPGSPREAIAALLDEAVDGEPGAPAGCLAVNTMVERGPVDDGVAAILDRDRRRRIDALTAAVASGQRAGSIRGTRPATDLAEFVLATLNGLRVAQRAGVAPGARRAIADTALDAL